ncbi:MAG: hypothetical protein ACI9HX_000508 [Pseudoalteromonas tetraodonis]|jgi:hypothetical protein
MSKEPIYRVVFSNQDKVYELYARSVGEGAMFGFVEIDEIIFGENSDLLIDPAEEKLKAEFEGVRRTYVPMHSIIRIDEVYERREAKITDGAPMASNVRPFPVYTGRGGS